MTITSMFSRPFAWVAAVAAVVAVVGCLPEFDEPPLTATGGAPEEEATSSSSSGAAAATCEGEYVGSLPGGSKFTGLRPCTIAGNVDMSSLTAAERQQVKGVKDIRGILYVSSPDHLTQLPVLTLAHNLTVNGYSGTILDFPSRINVEEAVVMSGGQIAHIKGFGGVKKLYQLKVDGMSNLESIDAFHALSSLNTIAITQLPQLKTFKAFTALTSVIQLRITNCQSLAALPNFVKLTSVVGLELTYMNSLATVAAFPALTKVDSLYITNLDNAGTVAFPLLTSVTKFTVNAMAKLADLEGFGSQLQIWGSLYVCDILMPAAAREIWRAKHAPKWPFKECSNGCTGAGSC